MPNPKTAVVILNWNGASLLREFLPSVLAGTPENIATTIVVDNGSTDDSIEVLRKAFPYVRTIVLDKNYGFAQGYNLALRQIADEFEYVVLLNSDVAVEPGWLEPLVSCLENNEQIGAVQPKILSYSDKKQGLPDIRFEYAGAAGGFIDRNGYPYCRGRIFSVCEIDNGQYDEPMQIFWATGAALMVRVKLYLELGGLDEVFFAHMEEIDLCWRILLAGKQIWVIPQSVVYHLGGGSLPAENPRKTYLNFRNNLLLLHKNLPKDQRRKTLFKRRLLDTLAWAKFILMLDFKNAHAIVKAHMHFRRMARNYTDTQKNNLLKEEGKEKRPNILWQYYVKGRKTFSALK